MNILLVKNFNPIYSCVRPVNRSVIMESRDFRKSALMESVKVTEVLSEKVFEDLGYVLRTEMWETGFGDDAIKIEAAYSLIDGGYIGDRDTVDLLCGKYGIRPEVSPPSKSKGATVCSIGFCEKEQKWYGWSHQAMYGFGIGDKVKKGDSAVSSGYVEGYLEDHPELDYRVPVGFKVKTLEDAKRVAIAFAESVG